MVFIGYNKKCIFSLSKDIVKVLLFLFFLCTKRIGKKKKKIVKENKQQMPRFVTNYFALTLISVHRERTLIGKEVSHDVFFQMRLSIKQTACKPVGGQSKFITNRPTI